MYPTTRLGCIEMKLKQERALLMQELQSVSFCTTGQELKLKQELARGAGTAARCLRFNNKARTKAISLL
jgi:hypothetical protein